MLKIGLTGSIGSGKSMVSQVFNVLGIPVYQADEAGQRMLQSKPVIDTVFKLFGDKILSAEGQINRRALAEIVFNDQQALKQLNAVIHPLVIADFFCWMRLHRDAPYILQEAAIIIESGLASTFDKMIVVTAPLETRIERVRLRDNASRESILARMSNQLTEEEKIKYADYQIINDGLQMVVPQVLSVHNKIISLT